MPTDDETALPARRAIEDRAALLADADRDDVIDLAERCILRHGDPTVVLPADVGLVMIEVRDPIAGERFHLGETTVARAEVEFLGQRGWMMRQGTDRVAALAGAVCDAVARAGAELADEVEELCRLTAVHETRRAAEEWAALAPTVVAFEELD